MEQTVSAPPDLMYQEMELLMALQLQHPEWFLHFESIQEQMVLELLVVQVEENYQASDQQGQGLVHHNLK